MGDLGNWLYEQEMATFNEQHGNLPEDLDPLLLSGEVMEIPYIDLSVLLPWEKLEPSRNRETPWG